MVLQVFYFLVSIFIVYGYYADLLLAFYTFSTELTHYIYYHMSGILAGRRFNIDLFITCSTKKWDLCHMSILISGQDGIVEQAHQMMPGLCRSEAQA